MMNKVAILQVADTSPLESLVLMLRSVGYDCYLPNNALKVVLRGLGCDTVLDISDLVSNWGYSKPMRLPEAEPYLMNHCDLYVDVKAHRNGPKVWSLWPNLSNKTLWYRINGGKPEHVVNARGDHGDEVNPPCPVLTPNQWYRFKSHCDRCDWWSDKLLGEPHHKDGRVCMGEATYLSWEDKSYTCWPPLHNFDQFPQRDLMPSHEPICLIHNLQGWGYGLLVEPMRQLGVKFYGLGSPDGLINHDQALSKLTRCVAMVHLKSNDAPGYAVYEALASRCPVICTRRLIWRCKMHELLIPGKTCLVFDRETHDALTAQDVHDCCVEVRRHLTDLRDPEYNRTIGEAGHARLKEIMWDAGRDSASLKAFMERHFG